MCGDTDPRQEALEVLFLRAKKCLLRSRTEGERLIDSRGRYFMSCVVIYGSTPTRPSPTQLAGAAFSKAFP